MQVQLCPRTFSCLLYTSCASFSFVEVFDKAQRDGYKYLHRKYDAETDWYTGAEHPAGAEMCIRDRR